MEYIMKNNSNPQLSFAECSSGGCGAKIDPETLHSILSTLPKPKQENLLVGYEGSDDAAVYELDNENCIISTLDFFSPMVTDPFDFGRIAAANALSDIYAMGGEVLFALNIVCFPEKLPKEILEQILKGGSEKVIEAGAVVAGGHSIYDKEAKYGLSVTGKASKHSIIKNNNPQIGHKLILTKALGVGIILAAHRADLASSLAYEAAISSMVQLNKYAASHMQHFTISACTDITGFGLLCHLLEMCNEKVSISITPSSLPILPEALNYANDFIFTAAGQRNRNHFACAGKVDELSFGLQEVLFDPQTSGGLLIAVDSSQAQTLLSQIQVKDPAAAIIGEVLPKQEQSILFEPERKLS